MQKTIALDDNEWGQVIDGLICRAELYETTATFYETGIAGDEIAEVSGGEEACEIALVYRTLIAKIQRQRTA